MRKNPNSDEWTVVSEDLKDRYSGLRRRVGGDEDFFRFGTFIFEREGLKITASNGTLYKDYLDGKL